MDRAAIEHRRILRNIEAHAMPDRDAVRVSMVWEDTWAFPGPALGTSPDDWKKHMRDVLSQAFDGEIPR